MMDIECFNKSRNTSIRARLAYANKFRELIKVQTEITRWESNGWRLMSNEVKTGNGIVDFATMHYKLDQLRNKRMAILKEMNDQESINLGSEQDARDNRHDDYWRWRWEA